MKTKLFLAAMIFAASGTVANAQVLGGDIVGGVGGSLGGGLGGMHDIGAVGRGSANGAFGGDLDARSLRRTTSDTAGRTAQRARSAANATRERTRSAVGSARNASEQAVATTTNNAHATAAGAGSMAAKSEIDDVAIEPAHANALDASPNASASGALDKSAGAALTQENERLPLNATGDAAANGDASASREGVRARGSASGSGAVELGK